MEDRSEPLALAYVLCFYESHRLHILDQGLGTWQVEELLEGSKVYYWKRGTSFG